MTSPAHELSLTQGMLYRRLGAGFAYPTAERLDAWQDGSAFESLGQAANALGSSELQEAIQELERAFSAQSELSLEEEYTYLFQRQAVASPYEGSYLAQSFFVQPQMLADVGAFYSAFGFQVTGDLQDHLGAQLEFMAALCFKEAYAREQGWVEQAETCVQARRRFLQEHLGRWLPGFVSRVKQYARLPFFVALAELTAALVSLDCAALGVTPDPAGLLSEPVAEVCEPDTLGECPV